MVALRTVTPDQFKKAMGSFVTSICNVTLYDPQTQKPYGIIINSVSSLSLDPPLLLFCLDKTSKLVPNFMNLNHFTVNLLASNQQDIVKKFTSGLVHPFENVSYHLENDHFLHLEGAKTILNCQVQNRIDQGDHIIMVGLIVGTVLQQSSQDRPLGYWQGQYV